MTCDEIERIAAAVESLGRGRWPPTDQHARRSFEHMVKSRLPVRHELVPVGRCEASDQDGLRRCARKRAY
jgi:hypothetical protein